MQTTGIVSVFFQQPQIWREKANLDGGEGSSSIVHIIRQFILHFFQDFSIIPINVPHTDVLGALNVSNVHVNKVADFREVHIVRLNLSWTVRGLLFF